MAYFFQRRILPIPKIPRKSGDATKLRHHIALKTDIEHFSNAAREYEFNFLNVIEEFPDGEIDWASAGKSKLWRYNLHYFDFVHEPHRSLATKAHLINHWILHNPPGAEDAWEPYTISLRIVNWIKFFLKPESQALITSSWLESLFEQACWLEKNLEYHILANHLLKNAKALFFAGMYFEGPEADRWLAKGLKLLEDEAGEQILPDGGHFERSPMYHSIVTQDYLDVLSIVLGSKDLKNEDQQEFFQNKSKRLLDFLFDIVMPDGQIPLLNDSALGIAPPPEKLFRYARELFGYRKKDPPNIMRAIDKQYSGYYIVKGKGDMLIVDVGEIGPDYQPGHAHCDTLSYEVCFDGQRIIVDSGVKDYELSATRCYARSTAAHNTLAIDGREQSEIWGAFRVGRRAKPVIASMSLNNGVIIDASHNGYDNLKKGPVRHRRQFVYDKDTISIFDSLTGEGKHLMESYIHLHPDLHVQMEGNTLNVIKVNDVVAVISVVSDVNIKIIKGRYFPQFGEEYSNNVIHMSCICDVPFDMSYKIVKVNYNITGDF